MLDFAFERQNSKTQNIYQIATNKFDPFILSFEEKRSRGMNRFSFCFAEHFLSGCMK